MAWFVARCAITVCFLALLVRQFGSHLIIERFETLRAGPLLLAALMLAVQLLLMAWRWKLLVDHFGPLKVSTSDLCWFLGASHLFGEFLPSTVGGDAVRTAMLARVTGLGTATLSVILDRITGLAMLLLIIVVLLPLLWWRLEQGAVVLALGLFSIGGLAALGALLLLRTMPSWIPRGVALLAQVAGHMREALFSRSLGPRIAVCGLLVQLLCVGVFFVPGRALGVLLPLLDCLLLLPPALLLSAIPVSLSGWGVRESALAGGFVLVGVPPADVVAVSILYGLTSPAIGVVYAVLSPLRP
jgi:glycosyltransferase 2 family protein